MHVLYLHQYFVTPDGAGGTRSYEFARRLVRNGHEVTLVTSSAFLPDRLKSSQRVVKSSCEGIDLVVIQVAYGNEMVPRQRMYAFVRFAWEALKVVTRFKADVVFATSTPLTIAIPAIWAKLWHRCPLVFEVRDLWPELPIALGVLKNPLLKALARWLEWIAYHASRRIIALSPGMAEGVCRRGISSRRVVVIPNSCDLERFEVHPGEATKVRDRLGLKADQPLVVYTGTFGKIYGIGYLVRIAAEMQKVAPDIMFLLVGSGAEYDQTVCLAQSVGVLDNNLCIQQAVSKSDVPAILAAASVVVSVTIPVKELWHNSANKFFDGLAAGKPLAINYEGWQADLLRETGAGIVLPPDDPNAAAELLRSFLFDPPRLEQSARAAKSLARERFSRETLAREFEQTLVQASRNAVS